MPFFVNSDFAAPCLIYVSFLLRNGSFDLPGHGTLAHPVADDHVDIAFC